MLVTIPLSLVLMLPIFRTNTRKDLATTARIAPIILLSQCFSMVGYFSYLFAALLAPITLVSAMGTLQPVFLFLIIIGSSIVAPRLLKEVITPRVIGYKILGLAFVITAAIILST